MVKNLFNNSVKIIVGCAIHPVYVFVNTVLLADMEDQTYLISFGICQMAIGLLLESIGIGQSYCVETLAS